ncbi:chemotaxis protein [Evansella halocellulosilytica]|uniref:chemotaxis protein n=1 Tax=Evansella halocellulosilytica TaxID=2011013 RepID=UPI000BB6C83B|nr:chemotaxis protein [Evansella halocellulosilytica]
MTIDSGILLESGTNELEIIDFQIGEGLFGINVMKVREIIQPLPITKIPHSHPHVEGVIRLREEIIPVIQLAKAIGFTEPTDSKQSKLIVSELNQMKVAFHVGCVSKIHRLSWEQIEKPTELSEGLQALTVGVVKMDERMILLLDFEKIVYDIIPGAKLTMNSSKVANKTERGKRKILIAEDSSVLRQLLQNTLNVAGYTQLTFSEDGKEAWAQLESMKEGKTLFDGVITDIEMPQMDGHHLTKRVKEDVQLKDLPVVIFSSLISGDLFHKGEKVGADYQVSKPDIEKIVNALDELLHI